ncbi:sensor histidine kinase [Pseudooceanicola sp. 502str34]
MTSRLHLVAALIICLFGTVFASSYIQILSLDLQLASERGERNLWAATQAEREWRILSGMQQSGADGDALDLQIEVFLSRLDLLLAAPQRDHFVALGLGALVDDVASALAAFDTSSTATLPAERLLEMATPLLLPEFADTLHQIATRTMLLERRDRVEQLELRKIALRRLLLSVIGAGLVGFALSGSLVRNLSRLARARDALAELNATLEDQVAQRNKELSASLAVERRAREIYFSFIMAVSHQFRTPVSAIHMISQRQMRAARSDPDALRRKFAKIYAAAERLNTILSTVVAAARIDAEDFAARRTRVDFNDVVREAITRIDRAKMTDALQVELSRVPLPVVVDADLLIQVVDNVVENALKYSDKGQPVRVRALWCTAGVECRVRDHGIGIPSDVGERIFDRFYRAPNAQVFQGMGLGLYLSRQILRLHGGRLSYTSDLGNGTEFRIFLPHPHTHPGGKPDNAG